MKSQYNQSLDSLCHALGVRFNNRDLLVQALTHSSYANERKAVSKLHNERLEFLGDAVLDLIISDYLYVKYDKLPEGELTKARAALVCEASLARAAAELKLGQYLLLGKGEAASGGRNRASILADAFEAVIGSVYVDCGLEKVCQIVINLLSHDLEVVESGGYINDYKTLLQEEVQKNGDAKIVYQVVAESGPDHSKVFEVAVQVNGETRGAGQGKTKKEAEQHAAKQALSKLNTE
ncbi:MAG: Ribonuclease 3 [Firmicutes bacterium]|nr:Ribonuclease 3 [Bacillota bacterium]